MEAPWEAPKSWTQAGFKCLEWREGRACPHMALDLSAHCSCLALDSSSGLTAGRALGQCCPVGTGSLLSLFSVLGSSQPLEQVSMLS